MNFIYPAICHFEDGGYWCEFPDLPGCFSQGDSEREIVENAAESLEDPRAYFLYLRCSPGRSEEAVEDRNLSELLLPSNTETAEQLRGY